MIRPSRLTQTSAFFAGLALVLSACSDSSTAPTGVNTAPLSQAEALQVGQEMRDEASGVVSGANLSEMLSPTFQVPFEMMAAIRGPLALNAPFGCATLSENPPTDADGDGVPDNLTITYDSTACTFTVTGMFGTAVFSRSGSIHVVDPSQTARRAVRFEFTALKQSVTVNDTLHSLRQLDGITQVIADSAGFTAVDSTASHRESSRFGTSDLSKRWAVTFTADSGQFFSHHSAPPSGTLNILGSTSRTRSNGTKTFTVATTTPLHVDRTCDAEDHIVSGELHVTYANADGTTTIIITWNGCGVEPTVTTITGTPS